MASYAAGESCPRLDVVHPGRAWSSSPVYSECYYNCSVLEPSSIRGLATPWTYLLHFSLCSVVLIDSSTGSPVHVLVSIQAVRGLPRLCVVNVTTTALVSALTLLFGRQEGHPVCKKLSCGVPAWLSVWSEVQNLHMARLMPLPLTVSCFSKIQIGFYRAMLCIRGTSHGPVSVRLSLRLSVCLSVCPSQVGVLLKRLNVGSHKQHHTRECSFRMPKISAKFHRGHPLRGRRMQVGWVKIGDF